MEERKKSLVIDFACCLAVLGLVFAATGKAAAETELESCLSAAKVQYSKAFRGYENMGIAISSARVMHEIRVMEAPCYRAERIRLKAIADAAAAAKELAENADED